MSAPGTRVVLAGGGTAGHTSPLIATASALRELEPEVELTAVGTARGLEVTVVPAAGLPLELIAPVPLPRRVKHPSAGVTARSVSSIPTASATNPSIPRPPVAVACWCVATAR